MTQVLDAATRAADLPQVPGEQLTELAPLLAQHLGLRVEDQDDGQNPITGSGRA